MKKLSLFLLCLCLISPLLFLTGCDEGKLLSSYNISLTYDDNSHTAECVEIVDYVNSSSNSLSEIKFHLYANAFAEGAEERVCTPSTFARAYPNGLSLGGTTIKNVIICGENVSTKLENDNMTLVVPLKEELFPDESVRVQIDFSLLLPNALHRFGYNDNSANFANFYPIACVYKNGEGFCTDTYTSNGDPFFSDVASYSLTVSYPKNLVIACSGDNLLTRENGQYLTTTLSCQNVRDIAFVLSSKFNVISASAGKTKVNYFYFNDSNAALSLQTSVKAVEYYSGAFGDYPYSSLAVVQTGFVQGGMEFPRLVMISDAVDEGTYQYVIAHEIAHQWWYGVVGNDEYNEAWLDESLTEFSSALFFENHSEYGMQYDELVSGAFSTYNNFLRVYNSVVGEVDSSMLRPLDEFATEPEYVNNIYTRGVIMFDSLRQEIGDKKLLACLKSYFKTYAYQNVTSAELVECFSKKSGRNLEGFFDSWLNGKVKFVGQ